MVTTIPASGETRKPTTIGDRAERGSERDEVRDRHPQREERPIGQAQRDEDHEGGNACDEAREDIAHDPSRDGRQRFHAQAVDTSPEPSVGINRKAVSAN